MQSISFLTDTIVTLELALSKISDIHASVTFVASCGSIDAMQLAEKQRSIDEALADLHSLVEQSKLEYQGEAIKFFDGNFAIEHTASSVAAIKECHIYEIELANGATKNIEVDIETAALPAELWIPLVAFMDGLIGDAVLEVIGSLGRETFAFESGTTAAQLVAMINLFALDTGVDAKLTAKGIRLRSTDVGSDAGIEIAVISEPAHGQLADSISITQAGGRDAVATVNGVPAESFANSLTLQTTKLDLFVAFQDGFEGRVAFSVNGGGIHLADPDNVEERSKAHRRVGLVPLLPSKLGGVSGRLFELGSGQRSCLDEDCTKAYRIASEAKRSVDRMRDRLESMKDTALEAVSSPSCSTATASQQPLPERQKSFPNYRLLDSSEAHTRRSRAPQQILVQAGSSVLDVQASDADIFLRR